MSLELATCYQRYVESTVQAILARKAEAAAFRDQELTLRGCESYLLACAAYDDHAADKDADKVRRAVRDALVSAACDAFSPRGERLCIDTDQLDNGNLEGVAALRAFDPVALWQHVENTYGGKAGQDRAHAQAAGKLWEHFRLDQVQELKTVAGNAVLEFRLWTDSVGRSTTRFQIDYTCQESIQAIFGALIAFADWSNLNDVALDCQRLRRHFHYHASFQSRQVLEGPLGEIKLTLFRNKLEFRFAVATAQKLNEFFASFRPQASALAA